MRSLSRGRLALVTVLAAVSLALSPAVAGAGTQCKSKLVSIGAINEDQAIAAWSKKVKHAYGAAWSNFNLAKHQSVTDKSLGVATLFFVSGYPCRHT
jgi:hypothetical protein